MTLKWPVIKASQCSHHTKVSQKAGKLGKSTNITWFFPLPTTFSVGDNQQWILWGNWPLYEWMSVGLTHGLVRILLLLSSRNWWLSIWVRIDAVRVFIRHMLAWITCLSLLFDVSGNGPAFDSQFPVPPPTCPLGPVKLVGPKRRTFSIGTSS